MHLSSLRQLWKEYETSLFHNVPWLPSRWFLSGVIFTYRFDWFADLGLKWYSLPAVSGMMFDCGGIQFTACPFNGWYMSSEIGCRNLCDVHRYNILDVRDNGAVYLHSYTLTWLSTYIIDHCLVIFQEVLERMKIELKNYGFLKKDRALVEVNLAVLHSFQVSWILLLFIIAVKGF